MAHFRVLDDETARQLSARVDENESIGFADSSTFGPANSVVIAPSSNQDEVLLISIRESETVQDPVPVSIPEPLDASESKFPGSKNPGEDRPQYVATGFLGLDDAPYEEEDDPGTKKSWWKRLFID